MRRPFLIIFCGVPCSGKSTIAKELAEFMTKNFGYSVTIVSSDTYRHMIPAYKYAFEPELEQFVREATYNTILTGLKHGLLVISDDMNYYASIRRKLARIAEQCRADYAIIYVSVPLELAIEWNKKRGEPIPNSLIEEIYYKFDEPGKEYKWDKPLLTVNPAETDVHQLIEEIAAKIHERICAEEEIPIRRETKAASSLLIDLERETRRAMGEIMKRFKTLAIAPQISELRKKIVKEAFERNLCPAEALTIFIERTEALLAQTPQISPTHRVIVHVGLFGHVDHGKTQLAACLTEKPSTAALDKHPEAQRRGMTIDMGFSAFNLDNFLVTLVDLPGHYSLIKQVMSGANIIDAGILVVAADEGPNVQTIEHLQILNALDIGRIVVALNKVDLVDAQRINHVKNEIQQLLSKTRFKDAPIVCVSALNREGIDDLKKALKEQLTVPLRQWSGNLKIPIDHAFPITGIGTVATGTILRGRIRVGDIVEIRPTGKLCKVKFIQVFGENVREASAGDRVGIALADVRPKEIERGYLLVSPNSLKEKNILDVRLSVEPNYKFNTIARRLVHVHIGLQTVIGKIYPYLQTKQVRVLKEKVEPGSTINALIILEKPVTVEIGEKALLIKMDLPPKQSRVMGLAEIINFFDTPPEMYIIKMKTGFISHKVTEDTYVVSGLFKSSDAVQHVLGNNVVTTSKIKGTILNAHDEKGGTLVKFETPPSMNEKVYFYKLRRAKIV